MHKRQRGFSLIELLVVSGVSGVLLLSWVQGFSYHSLLLDRSLSQAAREQHFYQLAVWLVNELERAREQGIYEWQWDDQCLNYGSGNEAGGVRVRNGTLQWRGGERTCAEGYWLNMVDTGVEITELRIYNTTAGHGMLGLSAEVGTNEIIWEHRFEGALYFAP